MVNFFLREMRFEFECSINQSTAISCTKWGFPVNRSVQHQYFERWELVAMAEVLGLAAQVTTKEITGYSNSPYRFNLWFEKP